SRAKPTGTQSHCPTYTRNYAQRIPEGQASERPDAVCVALHPGTVNSDLSKPFQGAVDANVLTAPSDCARNLIRAIDDLSAAESGGFFAYDGSPIPY
ncbi:MAG: hypothetical protein CFH10_00797, partial [Alphaproteobacteria bacterium MarineAlpha4_Bin2]